MFERAVIIMFFPRLEEVFCCEPEGGSRFTDEDNSDATGPLGLLFLGAPPCQGVSLGVLHGTHVLRFEVSGSPVHGHMSWELRDRFPKNNLENFHRAPLFKKKKNDLGPKLDYRIEILL